MRAILEARVCETVPEREMSVWSGDRAGQRLEQIPGVEGERGGEIEGREREGGREGGREREGEGEREGGREERERERERERLVT